MQNLSATAGKTVNGVLLTSLNNGYLANNMISIGNNDNAEYRGIWVAANDASATKQVYFNSVYIGETATGGNSYAFLRSNVNAPLDLRNNIFSNFRTGGTGTHYAIATQNTNDWTNAFANSNCYYTTNNANTGLWGAADVTFETWIANTGEDVKYLSTNEQPLFTDAPNCDLHINPADACAFNRAGENAIAGITQDWDNDTRDANHPDIGADEFTPTGGNDKDIWRGWVDSDWDNADNWGCQLAPLSTAEFLVPQAINYPEIDAVDTECAALTITYNGQANILPTAALTVNGALHVYGELNLTGNTNNVASLIDNGIVDGDENISVLLTLTGNDYHYVSAPFDAVPNTTFSVDPWGFPNPNFYYYDENTPGDWMDGWKIPSTGNMNIGKGYAIYHTGTITYTLNGGNINTGNINVAVTHSSGAGASQGWNLIGNPYPSAFKANDFITANSGTINGTLYFWEDADSDASFETSDYASWNGTGSTGNGGSKTPNEFVSTGQGFFVEATSPGNVAFKNTMRSTGNAVFFKSGENIQRFKIAVTSKNNEYNEILIGFTNAASSGFDPLYDGKKLIGYPNLAFYSLLNNEKYAIQAFPELSINNTRIVPVGIQVGNSGTFTFRVVLKENINPYTTVYLEDRLKGTMTNLDKNPEYTFTTDAGNIDNRFVLHFTLLATNINSEEIIQRHTPQVKIYAEKKNAFVRIENLQSDDIQVRVFDITGRLVLHKKLKNNELNKISLRNQNTGLYIVKVLEGNRSLKNKRIVIE